MKKLFIIIAVLTITCCSKDPCISNISPEINIWYGDSQYFGKLGNTQSQINILGNISYSHNSYQLYYKLNSLDTKNFLTLGSDLHRLAEPGDFNIEIFRNEIHQKNNSITVYIQCENSVIDSHSVKFKYISHNKWPLPYTIEWDKVENIQDVAEIVDGHWELSEKGIKTKNMFYDRMISIGDESWVNYEVRTTVTFHDFELPQEGPPTYNVSHAAIATRWPGHTKDGLQPSRQWHPLGATAEFRLEKEYKNCRWRIFDGEVFYAEQSQIAYRQIKPNVVYGMKHRVETLSSGQTLYSVKLWDVQLGEPDQWDFQAIEINEISESGSACLIAHNTDVTFGNVLVVPIHNTNVK
jgi:hypothetical protein